MRRDHLAAIVALTMLAFAATQAFAAPIPRSAKAKYDFRIANPCPTNRNPRGACPGYVIDHIEPLCAGGADAPHNMQWQSLADARAKDRDERARCARMRKERK